MKAAPVESELGDFVAEDIQVNTRLIPKDTGDIRFIENLEDMNKLYE